MLERPDAGTIYVLDVENGEQDADLHYTEGGILIKEVTDGNGDNEHRPSVTPSAIKELISEMYPGATILEIDTEAKGTEVDILHENIHKEVWLDTQNKWLYTEWGNTLFPSTRYRDDRIQGPPHMPLIESMISMSF